MNTVTLDDIIIPHLFTEVFSSLVPRLSPRKTTMFVVVVQGESLGTRL